jgi:uncharacterized phage infection (PIP) family protein YhgE
LSTVEYDLVGRADELITELEKAVRALKATRSAADDTTAATRRLEAGSKSAAKAVDDTGRQVSGASKVLKSFGGDIAGTTDLFEDLLEGTAAVTEGMGLLGPVALGAAGTLAGVGLVAAGLVQGFLSLAEGASTARDRLEEMGRAVDDEAAARLDAYSAGTGLLAAEFDELTVATGSRAAENIGALSVAFARLLDQFDPASLGTVRETLDVLTANSPWSELGRALDDALEPQRQLNRERALGAAASQELQAILAGETEALEDDSKALEENADEQRRLADARGERAAAAKAASETEAKAAEDLADRIEQAERRAIEAAADSADERAKIATDHWLRMEIANSRGWAKTISDQADALAEMIDATIEANEEELEAWENRNEQVMDASLELFRAFGDVMQDLAEVQVNKLENSVAVLDDKISQSQDRIAELRASDKANAEELIAAEEKRLEKLENKRTFLRRQAFEQQKAAQRGEALIAGALAIVQAFAQLGPIAGAVAAGAVGITTASQIAVINSQDPPLHDGGSMGADEFVFGGRRVRDGEGVAVLNQRAVESGGLQTVQALNRGGAGPAQPVRLVLADAGRVIGEAILRESRRPGSPLAAGRSGVIDPYSGRRW